MPRKNGLLYSAWLHYHGKAEGCTAALDKCSLCPHCSAGKRGPASAVPDAFPGEMLELQEYLKKKDVIWTWTEHSVSFQRTKPRRSLEEKGVFSFSWRGEKWSDIWEPHLYSTESRCSNGNRWRAHLWSAGMSLELVSEAMPVVEEQGQWII